MTEPPQTASLHVFIRGRVQGVGYRYFTVAEAQSRDLVGWVRNLESGEVEVWAEGPRPELERLLQALRQGPHLSRVESVTATWGAATGKHKRFSAISTAW